MASIKTHPELKRRRQRARQLCTRGAAAAHLRTGRCSRPTSHLLSVSANFGIPEATRYTEGGTGGREAAAWGGTLCCRRAHATLCRRPVPSAAGAGGSAPGAQAAARTRLGEGPAGDRQASAGGAAPPAARGRRARPRVSAPPGTPGPAGRRPEPPVPPSRPRAPPEPRGPAPRPRSPARVACGRSASPAAVARTPRRASAAPSPAPDRPAPPREAGPERTRRNLARFDS